MTKLALASFLAKYNDAATGIFKSGQSRGIGSDDMRTFVGDICDSLPFWLGAGGDEVVVIVDFDFSGGSLPTTGGTGSAGAIKKNNIFRANDGAGGGGGTISGLGTINPMAWLIALIDNPATVADWQLINN